MIKNTQNPIDNILLQALQQRAQTEHTQTTAKQSSLSDKATPQKQDQIDIANQSPSKEEQSRNGQAETAPINNGFRRTENFTNADGKPFTRIEEVTSTPNRTKRIVIQRNESGSTTQTESIIDRQEDGSFRLTQRFTNEVGETTTNIELNHIPQNADIILGRLPESIRESVNNPFQSLRGTQVDLTA